MINWIETHGFEVLVIYWFFSAAVSNLPSPKQLNGGVFYHWFYGFTHSILQFAAGAINRIPQVRQILGTEKKEV